MKTIVIPKNLYYTLVAIAVLAVLLSFFSLSEFLRNIDVSADDCVVELSGKDVEEVIEVSITCQDEIPNAMIKIEQYKGGRGEEIVHLSQYAGLTLPASRVTFTTWWDPEANTACYRLYSRAPQPDTCITRAQ